MKRALQEIDLVTGEIEAGKLTAELSAVLKTLVHLLNAYQEKKAYATFQNLLIFG
jgi:hypothetical protein